MSKTEFHKLYQELKDLVDSLTIEERIIAGVDKYDFEEQEKKFFDEHHDFAEAIIILKNTIAAGKEYLRGVHHKKMEDTVAKTTPSKLLVRYLNLPDFWKAFLRKRVRADEDNDENIRDMLAEMNEDSDRILFLSEFTKILDEIEEALKEKE
jgi:DNA-binding ferritin-like protein